MAFPGFPEGYGELLIREAIKTEFSWLEQARNYLHCKEPSKLPSRSDQQDIESYQKAQNSSDIQMIKKAAPSTPAKGVNARPHAVDTWWTPITVDTWWIPITVETLTEPAKEISEKKRESIDDILFSPISST